MGGGSLKFHPASFVLKFQIFPGCFLLFSSTSAAESKSNVNPTPSLKTKAALFRRLRPPQTLPNPSRQPSSQSHLRLLWAINTPVTGARMSTLFALVKTHNYLIYISFPPENRIPLCASANYNPPPFAPTPNRRLEPSSNQLPGPRTGKGKAPMSRTWSGTGSEAGGKGLMGDMMPLQEEQVEDVSRTGSAWVGGRERSARAWREANCTASNKTEGIWGMMTPSSM